MINNIIKDIVAIILIFCNSSHNSRVSAISIYSLYSPVSFDKHVNKTQPRIIIQFSRRTDCLVSKSDKGGSANAKVFLVIIYFASCSR